MRSRASTTPLDDEIDDEDLQECLDSIIGISLPPQVAESAEESPCPWPSDLPADVKVNLSECRDECIDREFLEVDPIFDSIDIDVPTTYEVECVFKSGNTEVSTGSNLVNSEPKCPIPGLDTGNTTKFIPGFSQAVPTVDVDVGQMEVLTMGFCDLDFEASTATGASVETTQRVRCVQPNGS